MEITSDQSILDIVRRGLRVTFLNTPDLRYPYEPSFSQQEKDIIDSEIGKLLHRKVIIHLLIMETLFPLLTLGLGKMDHIE